MNQLDCKLSGQAGGAIGEEVFSGGGEMGARTRAFDWSSTPMGPISSWPQSLKTAVRILITSRYAMWMGWGPELTFLYNDAYAQMTLGKKHPWALGRPVREVWSEIWTDVDARIRQVLDTGEATWDEGLLLFLERNGYSEETYHTFSYSPLTDDDGKIAGNFCVVTEETERIIGERQLRTLRSLATGLSAKITEHDVFAAIRSGLEANRQDLPFALTYLFDRGENRARLACATGIGAGHRAAPEMIEIGASEEVWPVRDLLGQKTSLIVEDLGARFGAVPAGAWDKTPTRALMVPVTRQGQDIPAGVFVAALNPYRQFDAAYAGFIDLLAGQIAAGIANARAHEEEHQRAEALAEIDRAKTAFFSNVSHEFRTPLTLMLGPTEDAMAAPEKALRGVELERVHRNELRLLKLVNTLLDFSRLEAGRLQASYSATDLCGYTLELASVFRSAVERAGLTYIVECDRLPQPVFVDPAMWEKIVLNLISNALKSTFAGNIAVRLVDRGGHAELTVRDTGTGIPEHEIAHLFERFRRIENARRRTYEGSGIGLALVQELVNMHGGQIKVQSRLGEGAAFTISLPYGSKHLPKECIRTRENGALTGTAREAFVQEALSWLPGSQSGVDALAQDISPSDAECAAAPLASEAGKRARVLLVDDNRDMREYVRRLLSPRFEVIVAENGREALRKASGAAPDLVLSDVMMPEMDGFQLLAALRAQRATSSVPVIMLSARAGEDARIEGMKSGADDYLVKPFTARELMARVESHINMTRFRKETLRREAQLREEAELARLQAALAIEHIEDAFCTLDPQWRLTYMNRAAEVMWRQPRDQGLGHSIWELHRELIDTEFERQLRGAASDRVSVHFEFFRASSQRWFSLRAYPAPDGGLVVYIRDVHEIKKTEQALRRSEHLAIAGRLAASIAHELNNPLEAVTNLLFLAKSDSSVGAQTRELLEVADKELQRLSHVASSSLKFYRQSTAPSEADIPALLDSVLFLYTPRIRQAGVKVEKKIEGTPPLYCLSGELQQVFANLIGNALDAMNSDDTVDEGKMYISVRPSRDWKNFESPGVRVTIADNGTGMSREARERLFEPFFTTKNEGTGLGLWVASGILNKHGARVRVRSQLDAGTVFSLFFPDQGLGAPACSQTEV